MTSPARMLVKAMGSEAAPALATIFAALLATTLAISCAAPAPNTERPERFTRSGGAPERLIPGDLASRYDSGQLALPGHFFDLDEDGQKDSLPPLLPGMTLVQIVRGDSLFHGKGGCEHCHGSEAQGLPARGKTLTTAIHFIPAGDWNAIDSLILVGMPEGRTRSPVEMPARGLDGNLKVAETRAIAAYIWSISQVKGEPWIGGHKLHAPHDWRASARTDIP